MPCLQYKKKELVNFFFLQVITEERRLDLTFYIVELGLVSGVPVKGELIFRLTCLTEIFHSLKNSPQRDYEEMSLQ